MSWLAIKPPTRNDLRIFASLQFPFWGIVVWLQYQKLGTPAAAAMLACSGALTIAGLLRPNSIRAIYRLWMLAVFPLRWLFSHGLLVLLYYGLLCPIGAILRLRGHDPLQLCWPSPAITGWHERKPPAPLESYLRQY